MLIAVTRDQRDWTKGWHSCNDVFRKQKGQCFYCNVHMTMDVDLNPNKIPVATRDHLFPRHAGFFLAGNMVMACRKCNKYKGERLPTQQEVLKAWELIYKDTPDRFVCETRNGKIVCRVGSGWHFAFDFHRRMPIRFVRLMRRNKPVLRLYT